MSPDQGCDPDPPTTDGPRIAMVPTVAHRKFDPNPYRGGNVPNQSSTPQTWRAHVRGTKRAQTARGGILGRQSLTTRTERGPLGPKARQRAEVVMRAPLARARGIGRLAPPSTGASLKALIHCAPRPARLADRFSRPAHSAGVWGCRPRLRAMGRALRRPRQGWMHNAGMADLVSRLPTSVASAPSLVDGIQVVLRDAIAQGILPKGYRLREMTLAAHFGCSSTPIREAIRRLEHDGLVKIYPRRGAEVISFSARDVAELYEVRLLLECHAIREGVMRQPSVGDLARVEALVEAQGRGLDDAASSNLDADFHEAITALAGNAVIAELVARTTRQIEAVQSRTDSTVRGGRAAAYEAHKAILQAVERGDAAAAETAMREHLTWSEAAVLASMTERSPARAPD